MTQVKNDGRWQLTLQTSDPTGAEGQLIYNSIDKRIKYHNGTNWVPI